MTKKMRWKLILVIAAVALGLWKSYPPLDIYNKEGEVTKEGKINLGLDLQGGMHLVLKVDIDKLPDEAKKDATDRALEIIRNRIDQFGVLEPVIQKQGTDRIIVQLPGVTDRERAIDIIGKTAHLEFVLVSDDPEILKKALDGEETPGFVLKPVGKESLLLEEKSSLTGDKLVDASVEFSQQQFGQPYVSLTFDSEGANAFSELTGANVERRLAIVLDGVVQSAPVIRERIPSGRAQITGSFSVEEANDLAIVLRAGALPAPTKIIEERTVGPTLGKDSIRNGLRAIVIGGIAVVAFMALYYLLTGLIADFALCLNLVFISGTLAYFDATLTLPGIAGLLLTIGMAVDANVLIFERIREERNLGKHIQSAISSGYQKAFLTILDSNITTLITALILFQFGTGPIRGFATTLSIGILSSMFTALIVTRLVLDILTKVMGMTKFPMLRLIKKPNINFIGVRKIAYIVSAVVIIGGMVAFVGKGEQNFGIDFTGGTLQQFRFRDPLSLDMARDSLREIDLGDSPIQQFGQNREVIIRTFEDTSDAVITKFREVFKDNPFEVLRIEKVGPAIGKDLKEKALWALFFAMIGICVYISFRFEFRFAIAAIAALLHDVLVSLGAIAISGREISLPIIAALLTIIGYSINDTIVVFDRIREGRRLLKKADFPTVINTSINQTLSRTILTSTTTLIVVLALCFLGGEVINDFAFVLMIGVIVGTYSSVFIASPILADWPGRRRR
ncbi:MAG: protein translocase subunit SecD [Candidatus Omnitrophica bacterium]|nr:protein translocase subunit SecD [Candidatus Omnitrophota bacterium]